MSLILCVCKNTLSSNRVLLLNDPEKRWLVFLYYFKSVSSFVHFSRLYVLNTENIESALDGGKKEEKWKGERKEGRREEGKREDSGEKKRENTNFLKDFIPQRPLASSQAYICVNKNKWLLLLLESLAILFKNMFFS